MTATTTTTTTFPIDVVKSDLQAVIAALDQGTTTSVELVKEYLRKHYK